MGVVDVGALCGAVVAWRGQRGRARGARVAIVLPNLIQYPLAMAAVLRAGMVVINVNPLYTPRELEHQLKDSGAQAIVILENFAHTLQQVIARTPVKQVVVASMGDLLGLKGSVVNLVARHVKKMVTGLLCLVYTHATSPGILCVSSAAILSGL